MARHADHDPLPPLRVWHARCLRRSQAPPDTVGTAGVLALTIATIERLHRANERLRDEHDKFRDIMLGRVRPRKITG